MEVVRFALTLVSALALGLLPIALSSPAEGGASHSGEGTVLWVDIWEGQILMTEGSSGTLVLSVDSQTEIVDVSGDPIPLIAIQPGDVVRVECGLVEIAAGVARWIQLLRPAWIEAVHSGAMRDLR